jgi:hypothetical protein
MSELTPFHADIKAILEQARSKARTAVNSAMVEAYWLVGQRIVQEEQQRQHKAQYGTRLMEALSIALTADFGKGFSMPICTTFASSTASSPINRFSTRCVENFRIQAARP